jgi:hypothetical protein
MIGTLRDIFKTDVGDGSLNLILGELWCLLDKVSYPAHELDSATLTDQGLSTACTWVHLPVGKAGVCGRHHPLIPQDIIRAPAQRHACHAGAAGHGQRLIRLALAELHRPRQGLPAAILCTFHGVDLWPRNVGQQNPAMRRLHLCWHPHVMVKTITTVLPTLPLSFKYCSSKLGLPCVSRAHMPAATSTGRPCCVLSTASTAAALLCQQAADSVPSCKLPVCGICAAGPPVGCSGWSVCLPLPLVICCCVWLLRPRVCDGVVPALCARGCAWPALQ